MNYNFLKDSYESFISGVRVNESDLEKFIAFKENSFILNHNINALSQFLKFLKGPENIFILNGFMGSGKTYVADCFVDFVDENVLVFKNSYQEAINLDDVLLSLFKDFSIYHNDKKIVLPKVESSIFSDKINSYIKYCDMPMLFIFDSFEINMRSKDTQKDILDFINYLSHYEKVKIVICSRSFREEDLISAGNVVISNLLSLSKEEVYDYLTDNSISGSNYEIEELYKATRGHYLLLELSVLIMKAYDLSLNVFSTEYKKSTRNFLEFLVNKILSLSSERFIKLSILLGLVRHGLGEKFIIEQGFAAEEDLSYLLEKRIIASKFSQFYMKDYIKSEFIKSINAETKITLHKYLIEVYESELPLKPFERQLFLSRQTMRQEINYHKNKIDILNDEIRKTGIQRKTEKKDFNYLSYSKTSGYENGMEKHKVKRYIKNIRPSDRRKRFELTNEDSLLLNSTLNTDFVSDEFQQIAQIENNRIDNLNVEQNKDESLYSVPDTLDDYVEIAQNYENAFNFPSAILYYKKALTFTDNELFKVKEPIIYTKLAICYKKIQDTDEAVRMYEKVYEIYLNESVDKANTVLLSIAQIYNEVYKFDKVQETYNRILYSPHGVSPEMTVRVYLDLSELADNSLDMEESVKYAQKALAEAEKLSDIKLLTECYFRYALLLDDSGNLDMAQKYYLRCIQSSQNPEENMYLASAYSNLAGLSLDSNNKAAAKMYYEMASDIDKKLNNYEGLYYSYTKLAELYKDDSPDKSYETLIKALSAAKHFDDITYAISIYLEIGSYYFDNENYKRALKSYIIAKTLVPRYGAEDINAKLNYAINKIKILVGDDEFTRLTDEIKRKK